MESRRYCHTCEATNSDEDWQREGRADASSAMCRWCGSPTKSHPPGQVLLEDEYDALPGKAETGDALLVKAEAGDAKAQFRMAMQFDGDDREMVQNRRQWLEAAAGQGHARACMELCSVEIEWSTDEESALNWYRRGRQLGHPHELEFLGYHGKSWKDQISLGPGPPTGMELIKCAEAGDPGSQYLLGECYAAGELGFPFDLIRAFAWFATAVLHDSNMEDHIKFRNLDELRLYLSNASYTLRFLDFVFDDEERGQADALVEELSPYRKRQRGKG